MTDCARLLPGVPYVESPFFEQIMRERQIVGEAYRVAKDLLEQGFAVMRFPDAHFDEVAERLKRSLAPRFDFPTWRESQWA